VLIAALALEAQLARDTEESEVEATPGYLGAAEAPYGAGSRDRFTPSVHIGHTQSGSPPGVPQSMQLHDWGLPG
jgi:hypothetical protein